MTSGSSKGNAGDSLPKSGSDARDDEDPKEERISLISPEAGDYWDVAPTAIIQKPIPPPPGGGRKRQPTLLGLGVARVPSPLAGADAPSAGRPVAPSAGRAVAPLAGLDRSSAAAVPVAARGPSSVPGPASAATTTPPQSPREPPSIHAPKAPKVEPTIVEIDAPPNKSYRLTAIVAVCLTIPIAALVGAVSGRLTQSRPAEEAPPSTSAAAVAPQGSVAGPEVAGSVEPAALTLIERARGGDPEAMKELSARAPEERSAEETLALAAGRTVKKQRELEAFQKQLLADLGRLEDSETLARLRELVRDRDTTLGAMRLLLELPSTIGPDLLYATWVRTPRRTETTQLAEELVYSKEAREKASPALKVALDLRRAETCEDAREVLPRAREHGDRRSVRLLKRLLRQRGCGPAKRDDCYECLRPLAEDEGAVSVMQALVAARRRPAPNLK